MSDTTSEPWCPEPPPEPDAPAHPFRDARWRLRSLKPAPASDAPWEAPPEQTSLWDEYQEGAPLPPNHEPPGAYRA